MYETIAALEERVEREPFNRSAINTLGDLYFEQADFLNAARTYKRTIGINLSHAPSIIRKFENKLLREKKNLDLMYALIELHLAEGVMTEVLEEISNVLDVDPHSEKIIELLLKIAHNYKKEQNLLPVLVKATKLNFDNSSLVGVLAGIYLDRENFKKAIELYEESVACDQNNISSWLVLAELYARLKHFDKSYEAYAKVLSLTKNYESLIEKLKNTIVQVDDKIQFLYLLAETYQKNVKPDEAIDKYREIISLNKEEAEKVTDGVKELLINYPDYPEGNFLFAEVAMAKEAYSEAVSILKKILEFTPKFTDRIIEYCLKITRLCPNQVYAYQTLGDIYLLKGDYVNCLLQYEKMLEIIPEESDFVVERARQILKQDANIIKAREVIARALFIKKQYKKALAEAEAIIAIDPNNAGAYLVLARAQLAGDEIDFAKKSIRTALNLDPYNREVHNYYQQIVAKMLDKKIFELSKGLEKDPWRYAVHYDLGISYFQKGLIKEAIGELQIAVKDAEKAYEIHKLMGICFKELGRYDLAIIQFEKALDHLPHTEIDKWKQIKFYIGLALEAQGDHKKALALYEEIMSQDIDYENIQLRIDKLSNFSWTEIRGKALAAILADYDSQDIVICWAKNSESDEFNKKTRKKNVAVPFSLEHNNKAVGHALQGRIKASEEELELASQMDPSFTIIYNNQAVIAMKKGEMDEAERLFNLGLDHNDHLPIIFANYAVLLYMKGFFDKAQGYYEKAIALDDTMFVTQINMGDLHYNQDQVEQAIVYWERAFTLGVVPELAKRRLVYKSP